MKILASALLAVLCFAESPTVFADVVLVERNLKKGKSSKGSKKSKTSKGGGDEVVDGPCEVSPFSIVGFDGEAFQTQELIAETVTVTSSNNGDDDDLLCLGLTSLEAGSPQIFFGLLVDEENSRIALKVCETVECATCALVEEGALVLPSDTNPLADDEIRLDKDESTSYTIFKAPFFAAPPSDTRRRLGFFRFITNFGISFGSGQIGDCLSD